MFIMIRRQPRSTQSRSSAASDVYKRQDQILSFDITDADSGVNWSTPVIVFNPADGITIGALDTTSEPGKAKWNITVDQNIASQRVVATITANDNVGNTGTLVRYLNVIPIPEIFVTDISVTDTDLGNPDPCLLYTSPSPRDRTRSRMPSSA